VERCAHAESRKSAVPIARDVANDLWRWRPKIRHWRRALALIAAADELCDLAARPELDDIDRCAADLLLSWLDTPEAKSALL
jgi:hypothetical protein